MLNKKEVEMSRFKIVKEEYKTDYMEAVKIKAIDENGKEIFGANCTVYRDKSPFDLTWTRWNIDWPTSGGGTYEEKLPHFEVIRIGMEELTKKESIN